MLAKLDRIRQNAIESQKNAKIKQNASEPSSEDGESDKEFELVKKKAQEYSKKILEDSKGKDSPLVDEKDDASSKEIGGGFAKEDNDAAAKKKSGSSAGKKRETPTGNKNTTSAKAIQEDRIPDLDDGCVSIEPEPSIVQAENPKQSGKKTAKNRQKSKSSLSSSNEKSFESSSGESSDKDQKKAKTTSSPGKTKKRPCRKRASKAVKRKSTSS